MGPCDVINTQNQERQAGKKFTRCTISSFHLFHVERPFDRFTHFLKNAVSHTNCVNMDDINALRKYFFSKCVDLVPNSAHFEKKTYCNVCALTTEMFESVRVKSSISH